MRAVGVVRKIDQLGRVVLPKGLRHEYEMNEGDSVEILVRGDHIILEKYRPRCVFCSSADQVGEYKKRFICKACINEVRAMAQ